MCVCVCVCEKLFDEIKMLQVNFIVIYIIHEMLVLLKITRILKRFLRSIIDFYFLKNDVFFTTCNDGKYKV